MTLEEALRKVAELEEELNKVTAHREELRDIAKRYMGLYSKTRFERDKAIDKHEKATAIIADMGGY
jgi:hypothetical protein